MKKLLTLAAAVLSLAASAAVEKLAVIQVADVNTIVQAAAKLGEFSGYPMLGQMASMNITANPVYGYFGPSRDGTSMAIVVYGDTEKLVKAFAENSDDADDHIAFAIVYPVSRDKAAFMSANPGSKEKDGFIFAQCDLFGECDDDDDDEAASSNETKDDVAGNAFTVFSEDGKWATLSKKKEYAKLALSDIAEAEKPLDGKVLSVRACESFIKLGKSLLDETAHKESKEDFADLGKLFAMIKNIEYTLKVGEIGIDIGCKVVEVPGSVLAECGNIPLAAEPFAFAPAGAHCACAVAQNAGSYGMNRADAIKNVMDVMKKHGLKLDWLETVLDGEKALFTLDVAAMMEYFKGEGAEAAAAFDSDKVMEDLTKALDKKGSVLKKDSPAFYSAFSLKGKSASIAPGARFAKAMPDVKGKKLYSATVYSLYGMLKSLAPEVAALNAKNADKIKPLLATLPASDTGAVAMAMWHENGSHNILFRIGTDEIRGLCAIGTSIFTLMIME